MQTQADAWVAVKEFDKGQVGVSVGLFEHMLKIADGLMGMVTKLLPGVDIAALARKPPA